MKAEVEHYKESYSFKSCPNAAKLQDKVEGSRWHHISNQ